jgi:MOSC domain-containing protein YiiM
MMPDHQRRYGSFIPGCMRRVSAVLEIESVNVATPRLLAESRGERVYSAIAKQPVVAGTTLWLSTGNLAGDAQADLSVHGGADKAIYAYPCEHWSPWELDLGEKLGPASFGENLSTRGAIESEVCIGDAWRWGEAVLEVCQPRWPCFKLSLHRGRADIQARMRATGRTGWYLRVLEPGEVVVGSSVDVIARDPQGLTVADAHSAMSDRHLVNRPLAEALAAHSALAAEWRDPLRERLSRK